MWLYTNLVNRSKLVDFSDKSHEGIASPRRCENWANLPNRDGWTLRPTHYSGSATNIIRVNSSWGKFDDFYSPRSNAVNPRNPVQLSLRDVDPTHRTVAIHPNQVPRVVLSLFVRNKYPTPTLVTWMTTPAYAIKPGLHLEVDKSAGSEVKWRSPVLPLACDFRLGSWRLAGEISFKCQAFLQKRVANGRGAVL